MKRLITLSIATLALLSTSITTQAQDFDDLYYNPKKETKKTAKTTVKDNPVPATVANYPSADTYAPVYTRPVSDADLDAYNRRTAFADTTGAVSVPLDSLSEFEFTRRIERYHNPDVVTSTKDADLIDYYYNQQPTTNVNVYVTNPGYFYPYGYNPYYYSYYPSSWGWRYNYGYWGPSWSLDFDPFWGPSFSWCAGYPYWGPSYWYPSYGWGGGYWPGHHHHWVSAPSYPNNWRPGQSGATRPHPVTGGGSTAARRPSTTVSGTTPWGSTRPGNLGAGRPGNLGAGTSTGTARWPSKDATRPYTPSNNSNKSNVSGTRGRNSSSSSNSYNSSSNSYNSSSRYNSNSSSNSYNSGSSWSSGRSSSSGGYSGGSRSGGSGASRGRR